MSIIQIKKRCDHETCTATHQFEIFEENHGWASMNKALALGLFLTLDYCPEHALIHGPNISTEA